MGSEMTMERKFMVHIWCWIWESNQGHIDGEASALTTAPPLHLMCIYTQYTNGNIACVIVLLALSPSTPPEKSPSSSVNIFICRERFSL